MLGRESQTGLGLPAQRGVVGRERRAPYGEVRGDEGGGGARRRGAGVRDEVSERDVGLVADGRHDRHRARGNCPGHGLVVEAVQVFAGAAAAAEDHDVHGRRAGLLVQRRDGAQRGDDRCGGAVALDRDRQQSHAQEGATGGDDFQHVAHRGAGRRSQEGHVQRRRRQRPFALFGEQPLSGQATLQCFKGQPQRAIAGRFHALADDLKFAAFLIETHGAEQAHHEAIPGWHTGGALPAAEQHAADLCAFVLQREVPVAGSGDAQVGNFALQPHESKALLEQQPGRRVQLADGEYRQLVRAIGAAGDRVRHRGIVAWRHRTRRAATGARAGADLDGLLSCLVGLQCSASFSHGT